MATNLECWPLIGWSHPLHHCLYPVSATVKAIKDRVVIRDTRPEIMWYTHSLRGARPKDTDYILILHIFRICSAALIFALLHNSLLGFCQQLLELSWGRAQSQPWNIWTQYLWPYPHAILTLTLAAAREVHSDFQKEFVLTGWPTNEWVFTTAIICIIILTFLKP